MRRSYVLRPGEGASIGRGRFDKRRDEGEASNGRRCLTRRAFVMGAAVAAGFLLWRPQMALADEPWWDGSLIFRGYGKYYSNQFWTMVGVLESGNGGEQSGTLYTDRWVSAKTPWVEWDISSNQYIRTASKITMRCDFATELYYHLTGLLEIACGSYNGRNASRNLWHTDSGDDTRFSLYHAVDDYPDGGLLEESKVVVIDNETGDGLHKDGAHIWTDYRSYPQNTYSVWIRRAPQAVKHSFQLRSWFWNYYYFDTGWYYDRSSDPPIGYSTKWVELQSKEIEIASNVIWGNRVVALESVARSGSRLESSNSPSAGTRCGVSQNASATRQHWILLENELDDSEETYRFVPVTSEDGSCQLDHDDGGPTMDPAAAKLWKASRDEFNKAQAFWIHGSPSAQWIFADCSGMALDCGGSSGYARFHSNGYPADEWDNTDHIWRMKDVRFSTLDGTAFSLRGVAGDDCVFVGDTVEVPNPNEIFSPGGSSAHSIGLDREYTWVVTEDDFPSKMFPEVVGAANLVGLGWLVEQPAVNLVGVMQRKTALAALSVRLQNSLMAGSVFAKILSEGVWRNGSSVGPAAEAVSLSLEGAIAQRYEVRYRACSPKAGWGAWVQEGQPASGPGEVVCGIQASLEPKGVVLQGPKRSITVQEAWKGKYLFCIARARTLYCEIPYRGAALSRAVRVGRPTTLVQFIADDDSSPCFEEQAEQGEAYRSPSAAIDAGRKRGCSEFEGWYVDKSCKVLFEEGSILQGDVLVLYGRSIAVIDYALTNNTNRLVSERRCFANDTMTEEVNRSNLIPPSEKVRYGTRRQFKRLASIWYEDREIPREAVNVLGVFMDGEESSSPVETMKVTGDATLYLAWRLPQYEGIEVS